MNQTIIKAIMDDLPTYKATYTITNNIIQTIYLHQRLPAGECVPDYKIHVYYHNDTILLNIYKYQHVLNQCLIDLNHPDSLNQLYKALNQ